MILLGFVCVLIGVNKNSQEDTSSRREDFLKSQRSKVPETKRVQKSRREQGLKSKEAPSYMKPLIKIVNEELEKFEKENGNANREENRQ